MWQKGFSVIFIKMKGLQVEIADFSRFPGSLCANLNAKVILAQGKPGNELFFTKYFLIQ